MTTREQDLRNRYGAKAIVGVFDSMDELMAATLKASPKLQAYWGAGRHGLGWYGLDLDPVAQPTFAGICRYLGGGWERGATRITEALDGLRDVAAKPVAVRRQNRWSDQGHSLDIHRVYSGQLDRAWQQCRREAGRGPQRVTLVCDAIERGGANADQMFWRGAAVVALADKLTQAGYSVEVVSAWHGNHGGDEVVCHVTVKQFHEPIDITTLAAAVACPAFFRCIGHCWGNLVDGDHGHGYTVLQWIGANGEIVATHDRSWDATVARRWIEEQITKLEQLTQEAA